MTVLLLVNCLAVPARAAQPQPAQLLDCLLQAARLGTVRRLPVPAEAAIDRAWIVDGVFGVSRVRALAPGERFEDAVLHDLAELQFRCSGALDSEFDLPHAVPGGRQASSALLACRGPRNSVLAVVYLQAGKDFAAWLHEGQASMRDRILDKQARLMRAMGTSP